MSQITIQDLSFTYEGDHVPVFQHLDLQLDTRWKLGLVGRNGRGKTTLLRLLEGSLSGGGVLTRPDRTIYFPRLVAEPERPAREILLEGIPWEEEWMLLRELNRLGLDEDILDRPFSSLSGGEQTRAGLARLFCQTGTPCWTSLPTPWMRPDAPSQPGTSGGWTAASFWCPTTGPFWMPAPTTRWL